MYGTALSTSGDLQLWEFLRVGMQPTPNDGYLAVQTIAHPLKVA